MKYLLSTLSLLVSLLIGWPVGLYSAEGPIVQQPHVKVSLVTDVESIAPGESFTIGIRYRMDPEWHIYWKNPGDTGIATSIEWDLPDGFQVGEIQWPTPITYLAAGLMNYVYEDEVVLMAEVTPPGNLNPGSSVSLAAGSDWLVCTDVCIPGEARLTLDLPVQEQSEPDELLADLFDTFRQQHPHRSERWTVQGEVQGREIILLVESDDEGVVVPGDLYFFSSLEIIDPGAPQRVDRIRDHAIRIVLEVANYYPGTPDSLPGVLRSSTGWEQDRDFLGLRVNPLRPDDDGEAVAAAGGADPGGGLWSGGWESSITVWQSLLFALLGGILLNLMPCVFPVLGIKILGFARQAGGDPAKIRLHGLIFTAGVLASVSVLVGVLLIIRAGGELIGWGFQLQEPWFVAAIAFVFFLFGLNLAGVFEVGHSLVGTGSGLAAREGFSGSFFSGILAVVVATPCTAPFMGPAVGFALAQPAILTFFVFVLLGLGLSLPYLILSFRPSWIERLPRPGPWMESFKQFMSFLLFAALAWILWLFGAQAGNNALGRLLFGLLLAGLAVWIYGRWGQAAAIPRIRRVGCILSAPILVAGAYLGINAGWESSVTQTGVTADTSAAADVEYGVVWEAFSPARLDELRQEGKWVYLDFTADWCLTCLANKRVVFSSANVRDRFNQDDALVAMKADWTRRDSVITEALAGFGRSGVPLNVIYPPAGAGDPIILPTALTPGIVMDYLDRAQAPAMVARD